MKISFDFDDTLSTRRVQLFALSCKRKGHDVHIVTSRMSNERAGNPNWNDDLYIVADVVEIPKENIHFCNLKPKHEFFLENSDFDAHLDDDPDDIQGINYHCETTAGVLFVDNIKDTSFKILEGLLND